ncbi:50S ribosomal protein L25 [Spirochaeta cellobiosiphila]|uniref:50S ribosomal protein L25 n=1 Tax=Spirochaeta cellobiosiphila TaxID=504483 RepID=UPI0003FCD84B|nr:50S ribosomal protein L25 [Spirochaeta cellobiosiphila]
MEQKTLAYEIREELTKGAARRLRAAGQIPAVVYGVGTPSSIAVNAKEFDKNFATISESTIITLQGKEEKTVLVKDYQEDVLKGVITHLDFYEIQKGKKLNTHVSIHVTGNPVGVREGGLLDHALHEIEIECLPKDLPEQISINIEGLNIGDAVHVSDIAIPEGVKILTNSDSVVASITGKVADAAVDQPEVAEETEVE